MAQMTDNPPVTLITTNLEGVDRLNEIGIFTHHLSKLLVEQSSKLSVIYAGDKFSTTRQKRWKQRISEDQSIRWLRALESEVSHHPAVHHEWYIRRGEAVADSIPTDTEILYTFDHMAPALHHIRARRFRRNRKPVTVTILTGGTMFWQEANRRFPDDLQYTLGMDYCERYSVQHSDFVVAPSQHILDWVRARGYKLPPDDRVIVLPPPFKDTPRPLSTPTSANSKYQKLIYYGPLTVAGGLETFLLTLKMVEGKPGFDAISEIVLLTHDKSTIKRRTSEEDEVVPENKDRVTRNPRDTFSLLLSKLSWKTDRMVRVEEARTLQDAYDFFAAKGDNALVVLAGNDEAVGYRAVTLAAQKPSAMVITDIAVNSERFDLDEYDYASGTFERQLAGKVTAALKEGPSAAAEHNLQLLYDVEQANNAWTDFHARVAAYAAEMQPLPEIAFSQEPGKEPSKLIDVCVPYYNHPKFLPQFLESMRLQTCQDYNMFIMNDGSTDPVGVAVFDAFRHEMQENWHFANQENAYVGAARNAAARMGSAKYVLFIDPDDIAEPKMVQRFIEGMEYSGADMLSGRTRFFVSDFFPYDKETGVPVVPPSGSLNPLGDAKALAMLNDVAVLNTPTICIKREVFEAINGYTELRFISYEDVELGVRTSLAGYEVDTIPEYVYFYRVLPTSVVRTTNDFLNWMRVQRHFRDYLTPMGMGGLAPAMFSLYNRTNSIAQPWDTFPKLTDPSWIAETIPWKRLVMALRYKTNNAVRKVLRRAIGRG